MAPPRRSAADSQRGGGASERGQGRVRGRSRRYPTPPTPDEILSLHEISSDEPQKSDVVRQSSQRASQPAWRGAGGRRKSEVVTISDSDAETSTSMPSNSHHTNRRTPAPRRREPAKASQPEEEDIEMEEVDVTGGNAEEVGEQEEEEEDLEMEDVDVGGEEDTAGYAALYSAAVAEAGNEGETGDRADQGAGGGGPSTSNQPVFKDGKGQPPGVISLSLGGQAAREEEQKRKAKQRANENRVTPRDRQTRMAVHKLGALALLAHARIRNAWLNDAELRDALFEVVPAELRNKLKQIHPKRVANQRERVRLFEIFMLDLVCWWAYRRFRIESRAATTAAIKQPNADVLVGNFPLPGIRVDGWIVESALEREERWKAERAAKSQESIDDAQLRSSPRMDRKGKGKATDEPHPHARSGRSTKRAKVEPATDITLFGQGSGMAAVTPTYLRLAPPVEAISCPADLQHRAELRQGSRETSAQIFCCLCRALGIPARLVISLQVAPWSAGAAKVATTQGTREKATKGKGKGLVDKARKKRKPDGELTSDDEEWEIGSENLSPAQASSSKPKASARKNRKRDDSDSSSALSDADSPSQAAPGTPANKGKRSARAAANESGASMTNSPAKRKRASKAEAHGVEESAAGTTNGKGSAKKRAKKDAKAPPSSPRPLKDVPYTPNLRKSRPKQAKATELTAEDLSDMEYVDLEAAPTMWVEVFSKPWQKWMTIDPIRAKVEVGPNRHMEPPPSDRRNKLVYVVAFEEDGFARDVTARYTKTLHSRVNRMRPPAPKGSPEGWWESVVRALHRPQKLDRDAAEDLELEDAAGKEPMPSSVGGFKGHPVYAIEKHLLRDEVIYPLRQIGTFQGIKVYPRGNVVTCRSARQWYNEGKVVKDGEEPLKWVKSRGYTLANKRAEEAAKADGGEAPQEGLYAPFQTGLYTAPQVINGEVPKNAFGNIDLFVPSMLPPGGVHIPYNGAGKVAKKLGVSYAEAITGFEFRKFRSMPKLTGIVVAEENEDLVTEAYWESEHAAAQKEFTKRQERALKNWKKVVNAVRIAQRVQQQYGNGTSHDGADLRKEASSAAKSRDAQASENSRLHALEADDQAFEQGGFLVDVEGPPPTNGNAGENVEQLSAANRDFAARIARYGARPGGSSHRAHAEASQESDFEEEPEDGEDAEMAEDVNHDQSSSEAGDQAEESSLPSAPRKIISLASLASSAPKHRRRGRQADFPLSEAESASEHSDGHSKKPRARGAAKSAASRGQPRSVKGAKRSNNVVNGFQPSPPKTKRPESAEAPLSKPRIRIRPPAHLRARAGDSEANDARARSHSPADDRVDGNAAPTEQASTAARSRRRNEKSHPVITIQPRRSGRVTRKSEVALQSEETERKVRALRATSPEEVASEESSDEAQSDSSGQGD
ncbi:Nucleotide excision repair complex XPC-HR23B, subunit XPC/DPB11 [Ceraceosorus bombacis]|uniref:Nucleotide excision repair complex XPC-HR23B, subunit XPC/DPB11 n=1 Tax=Ceraceosorus bombacis TaxID=401625 RepID=A0A0P1B9S5_9BASI|nr:Nucleotide excision repair complex XPC-HR23B, subunit XPC/DPB11 [Ceraceosorus bombacis]